MKNNRINGFNKGQIFQLYAYVVAYEESGIEKYESTKTMLSEHPELYELVTIAERIIFHKSKAQEMKDIDIKLLTNEVYQTKIKQNNILSLFAHLRNSIAHGNSVSNNGNILITDFAHPRYNPVEFTARGCLEMKLINQITLSLKSIEL